MGFGSRLVSRRETFALDQYSDYHMPGCALYSHQYNEIGGSYELVWHNGRNRGE